MAIRSYQHTWLSEPEKIFLPVEHVFLLGRPYREWQALEQGEQIPRMYLLVRNPYFGPYSGYGVKEKLPEPLGLQVATICLQGEIMGENLHVGNLVLFAETGGS